MTKHILSILVQNQPGVLVRVANTFSRREFNIDSLAVGTTESSDVSRITVVVTGSPAVIGQIVKQIEKVSDVEAVHLLNTDTSVCRGMTMIKIRTDDDKRLNLLKAAELFRAHAIDVQPAILTFEITGDDDKVTAFMNATSPYGEIMEVIRTGLIGLERGQHTIYEHCKEKKYYGTNGV